MKKHSIYLRQGVLPILVFVSVFGFLTAIPEQAHANPVQQALAEAIKPMKNAREALREYVQAQETAYYSLSDSVLGYWEDAKKALIDESIELEGKADTWSVERLKRLELEIDDVDQEIQKLNTEIDTHNENFKEAENAAKELDSDIKAMESKAEELGEAGTDTSSIDLDTAQKVRNTAKSLQQQEIEIGRQWMLALQFETIAKGLVEFAKNNPDIPLDPYSQALVDLVNGLAEMKKHAKSAQRYYLVAGGQFDVIKKLETSENQGDLDEKNTDTMETPKTTITHENQSTQPESGKKTDVATGSGPLGDASGLSEQAVRELDIIFGYGIWLSKTGGNVANASINGFQYPLIGFDDDDSGSIYSLGFQHGLPGFGAHIFGNPFLEGGIDQWDGLRTSEMFQIDSMTQFNGYRDYKGTGLYLGLGTEAPFKGSKQWGYGIGGGLRYEQTKVKFNSTLLFNGSAVDSASSSSTNTRVYPYVFGKIIFTPTPGGNWSFEGKFLLTDTEVDDPVSDMKYDGTSTQFSVGVRFKTPY